MNELEKRLDKLRFLVQDQDFLKGKGLSNEVNIRVFCYEPEDEMIVRSFMERLGADKTLGTRLIVFNLYELFLEICEDLDILDSIPEVEKEEGSAYALEQLHSAITSEDFIQKMREKEEPQEGSVVVLTGVGDVFPFMRVHKLLETMQPYFSRVPILVLYPGSFDGNALKLFNLLAPNSYYRAFNVV